MPAPTAPIRVYSFPLSGHAHRVRLFLSLLGLPHEVIDVDLPGGAHKAPDFLARNAFGQVPVIEDGTVTLADSTAILLYLALRYDDTGRWYPRDPIGAGAVQRWLSAASGPLAAGPSSARLATVFGAQLDADRARAIAADLFGVLEGQLADREFLVGTGPTVADIALYTYTAHAPEGGVSLAAYPRIRAWLARIEALPGFIAMPASPMASAA